MRATLKTRYLGNAIIVYPKCAVRPERALPRPSAELTFPTFMAAIVSFGSTGIK